MPVIAWLASPRGCFRIPHWNLIISSSRTTDWQTCHYPHKQICYFHVHFIPIAYVLLSRAAGDSFRRLVKQGDKCTPAFSRLCETDGCLDFRKHGPLANCSGARNVLLGYLPWQVTEPFLVPAEIDGYLFHSGQDNQVIASSSAASRLLALSLSMTALTPESRHCHSPQEYRRPPQVMTIWPASTSVSNGLELPDFHGHGGGHHDAVTLPASSMRSPFSMFSCFFLGQNLPMGFVGF